MRRQDTRACARAVQSSSILYANYDEVQLRLECLSDDIDVQLSEREDFESSYFKIFAKAQELILHYEQGEQNKSEPGCNSSVHNNNSIVKLPTI